LPLKEAHPLQRVGFASRYTFSGRRTRFSRRAIALAVIAVLLAAAEVRPGMAAGETVTVLQTFDKRPFRYRISPLAERSGYHVYRLTYPSPMATPVEQNNTVPADFYLPDGIKPGDPKRPAVVCLHILDGNAPLTDVVCSVLAARGIPAIMFKLPYYGERGLPKGPEALADDPKLFVGAIAQAGEDIRRTIDLLASRPEIDPQRIGITGISLGGIIAATAAGADPRLHRAGLILAGGDLLRIIHHARETRPLSKMIQSLPPPERADVEAKIAAVDPLKFAPALRDRAQQGRVLMINAGQDEVIPRECTDKLATALGMADRVTWLDGLGHYTALAELPRALRTTAEFFAQDLPEGVKGSSPPPTGRPTPLQQVVALAQQAVAMLTAEPEAGRCHFVEIEAAAAGKDRKSFEGRLRLVRGTAGKFALRGKLPVIGEVALGQGQFPWMLSGGKTVLAGVKNPVPNANPLSFAEPRHVAKLCMVGGIVGTLALAPEVLNQWITVEEQKAATGGRAPPDRAASGNRVLRITGKEKLVGSVQLVFRDDGRTPDRANVDVAGVRWTLQFRIWQINRAAQESLFEPPADLPRREVDQADLHRVFSDMFNFVMEGTE
jgi:dienelactone hydrolase